MERAIWLAVTCAALALIARECLALFPFVADDAYIVLRYARNLVQTGQLVFNDGERVSALTSPLHALLSAFLYRVSGENALNVYKWLCCVCVAAAVWLTARSHRGFAAAWPLALVLLAAAPPLALWTFGGLETPLLLLTVAAFAVLMHKAAHDGNLIEGRRLIALHLLAAAAFLIRHDSVCFFAPALLALWPRRGGNRALLAAVALAAVPCIAWLGFAWDYFGELLPTSFYVKTPTFDGRELAWTAGYELFWLTLLGVVPLLLAAFVGRCLKRDWALAHSTVVLAAGLAGIWLYGVSVAQKHMMFGFRHGVAYLPAAVVLLTQELRRLNPRSSVLAGALLALLAMHAVNLQRMLDVSVNGYWKWGEFPAASVRNLVDLLDIWKAGARDIQAHWARLPQGGRAPRISTYAAGVMPYELPHSYIFEQLISARRDKCAGPYIGEPAADYIHLRLSPRNPMDSLYYVATNPRMVLISDRPIRMENELRRVQVYYNPEPEAPVIPPRFNDACLSSDSRRP